MDKVSQTIITWWKSCSGRTPATSERIIIHFKPCRLFIYFLQGKRQKLPIGKPDNAAHEMDFHPESLSRWQNFLLLPTMVKDLTCHLPNNEKEKSTSISQ